MYVSGFKNINMELEGLNLPLDLNIEGPSTRYFIQTCLFNFKKIMVELGGLEPPTFSLQMRRSSQVNYSPKSKASENGGRAKNRTWDLSLIRTAL